MLSSMFVCIFWNITIVYINIIHYTTVHFCCPGQKKCKSLTIIKNIDISLYLYTFFFSTDTYPWPYLPVLGGVPLDLTMNTRVPTYMPYQVKTFILSMAWSILQSKDVYIICVSDIDAILLFHMMLLVLALLLYFHSIRSSILQLIMTNVTWIIHLGH